MASKLNKLCLIRLSVTISMIKCEVDRQFLLAQRVEGKRGCMRSVDNYMQLSPHKIAKAVSAACRQ